MESDKVDPPSETSSSFPSIAESITVFGRIFHVHVAGVRSYNLSPPTSKNAFT